MHNEVKCVMRFFKALGWGFSLDDEETVRVDIPEDMTTDDIGLALAQGCHDQLLEAIEADALAARRQFVGGPHNGSPHGSKSGQELLIREYQGCYSVYRVGEDGRAWFQGYARSMNAARRGELTRKPENENGQAERHSG